MTYDELVTSIRNYTEVGDNVFTESVLGTFILMAENRILRDIDLDVFKVEEAGAMTTGDNELTAPSSILTHRYLTAQIGGETVFLSFRDTSFLSAYWPDSASTGVPKYYSVLNPTTFLIAPTPDDDYVVEFSYIAKPTQLSSANTTTWVSTNAPEALLYACLVQAYSYTKGPLEMLQYFEASYTKAIQGLGVEQQGRRRRDEYRDGMVRMPLKSESPGP